MIREWVLWIQRSLYQFKRWQCSSRAVLVLLFLVALLLPPTFAYGTTKPSIVQTQPSPPAIEQQARQLYQAREFSAAIALWQQAAAACKTRGDVLGEAIALSNLSLTYQQLGQWQEANLAVTTSLNLIRSKSDQESKLIYAQALDVQGRLQLAQGQANTALSTWQQAAALYSQLDDRSRLTRNRLNQAQALQVIGHHRQAEKLLTEVTQTLQAEPDSLTKATGLRSLGTFLRITGNLEQSRQALQQSLAITQKLTNQADGETLLNLGNTARTNSDTQRSLNNPDQAQQDTQAALDYYQQAVTTTTSPITRTQAQLNQFSLLVEQDQLEAAIALQPQIQAQLNDLPASRSTIYARVNYARNLLKLETQKRNSTLLRDAVDTVLTPQSQQGKVPTSRSPIRAVNQVKSLLKLGQDSTANLLKEAAQVLAVATQQARSLADSQAEAYTIGALGSVYEKNGQPTEAQRLTRQALLIAQSVNAVDIAYQWQWQLGRLLWAQGDIEGAIAAYSEAVKMLQSLRSELVATHPDVQFSFREDVEPVYRQFVELLLQPQEPSQANLVQARQTIESLQLAELDNFLREACLQPRRQIDQVLDQEDPTAAAIYPIVLSDRLEVILKLPQQPLRHYTTLISQQAVDRILEQLRQDLVESDTQAIIRAQSLASQIYNWLIRPLEADLAAGQIKSLVFVLDGALRNIPMAALYDGNHYLLEKYNLALTPGLQLINPQPLRQVSLKALAAGLTEARDGFSPLPNVKQELESIQTNLPGQILLDQAFTTQSLQQQINLQSFPVIHLATHGEFNSNPDKTFLLAWDKRIKANEINQLFRTQDENNPAIELLVLSACETAVGDKRAALGIAGVAIRAGARSTIASLWIINDESAAFLMQQFYEGLTTSRLGKAAALRQAQLTLLTDPRYKHPRHWAPYVLVGNWL